MTIDLAHLRKLASNATPGPWATWAGKGWPEAASIVMPPEMCIGVWWPLRAPNETQHDKPLAWFRDPQDQAFAAIAAESLLPLVDEVERLRKQLGDALETIRRLTPSVSAPKGLCIATISGGGGVGGPTGPDYTVWTPDGATLHGEEARRFLEAPHAPKGDADV